MFDDLLMMTVMPSDCISCSRCNIQGSVICNYAHIKDGCTIKDCQVGANHTVKGEIVI